MRARREPGESDGKRLLVGEVKLDRFLPDWTYKIALNGERLSQKKFPTWTVWLEVPLGGSIDLEVSVDRSEWQHCTAVSSHICPVVFRLLSFALSDMFVRETRVDMRK